MRRLVANHACAFSVALAAILVPCAITASALAHLVHSAASGQQILALIDSNSTYPSSLTRLKMPSLRPQGPTVSVPEYHDAWAFSPNAGELALARGGQGVGIEVVDLRRMRLTRGFRTGIAAEALAWFPSDRLVASLQRGGTVVINARTGRVLRRWPELSFPDASASTKSKLVLLIPPLRSVSPYMPLARVAGHPLLAVIDSKGKLRTSLLRRITLGVQHRAGLVFPDHAALAVDPRGQVAVVFAAGSPVAMIDLRNMHVEYHRVTALTTPKARSCRLTLAYEREALWLSEQRVVITGRNLCSPWRPGSQRPAGALELNTSTWRVRSLDPTATGAVEAQDRLLVYGARQAGLRIYGRGRVRVLFPRRTVIGAFSASPYILVRTAAGTYTLNGPTAQPRLVHDAPVIVDVFEPR